MYQPGPPSRQRLWAALRAVPPGRTLSYAQLAAEAGNPRAPRAAGAACAYNLIAPVVPCHRALRSDGSLGGYYYGLDRKTWLLRHEGARPGLARHITSDGTAATRPGTLVRARPAPARTLPAPGRGTGLAMVFVAEDRTDAAPGGQGGSTRDQSPPGAGMVPLETSGRPLA